MDPAGGARHPAKRKRGGMQGQRMAPPNPQLFDDTSTQQPPGPYAQPDPNNFSMEDGQLPGHLPPDANYNQGAAYGNQGNYQYPGQQYLNDPMANVAMQYGQTLADQGKDYVHKNIEKYVSTNKLKYYFAVDTTYVGKKLGLLIFPYAHTDWSIKYSQEEPVAPRYEVNAPDLYIPVMAFVTYILLAGVMLGTQDRFTPEQLGITSSTALVWLIIEILVLLLSMYVMNVTTDLKYYDLLAYCGYKYLGMIAAMLGGLLFHSVGYYIVLLWMSLSLAFFLVRALKLAIMPHTDSDSYPRGNKRRLYMLLVIAFSQPVFMWWLTWHLVPS